MDVLSATAQHADPTGALAPARPRRGDNPEFATLVRQLHERHWSMLWLSLGIVVASFALVIHESESVGPSLFPGLSVPLMCGNRALFGVECPGCGLTRSFLALADGDLVASLRFHRMGVLLAVAVVLQIPYRLLALHELRTKVSRRTWPQWFGWLLIAALVGNWLLKVYGL